MEMPSSCVHAHLAERPLCLALPLAVRRTVNATTRL
jgi:hypothetical protein